MHLGPHRITQALSHHCSQEHGAQMSVEPNVLRVPERLLESRERSRDSRKELPVY